MTTMKSDKTFELNPPNLFDERLPSYGTLLKEVGVSATGLLRSEAELIKAEMEDTAQKLGDHFAQAVVFGALLGVSILPFLAFLVIGLGKLMGGAYWLSSLVVAVGCAAVGGPLAYRAFAKMKNQDLSLSKARRSLDNENKAVIDKVEELANTAKRRTA